MDKFVIYVIGVGYYTGKTFKFPNAKEKDVLYAKTTNDPNKAKQYTSYGMALKGMKALKAKCEVSNCITKRLSECEVLSE